MMDKGIATRCAVGILGGLMLAGVGTAALAAWPDPEGTGDVDVNVEIAALPGGDLTLTVADDETTLTESTSTDPAFREFTGSLPQVTVTDTRDDVPAGLSWYVTGKAGNFVGDAGQPAIPASLLGWTPAGETIVDPDGTGLVAPGDEVVPSTSTATQPGNNTGLVSGEDLLYLALDSADAQAEKGSWSTTAALKLKTASTVAPGNYTSTLTLSLFEDEY